jgi:mannose/cellobiose epimerase-like protein (N-acyl-D-glucosamine 2-epimerase family)
MVRRRHGCTVAALVVTAALAAGPTAPMLHAAGAPPGAPVPAVLTGETWLAHLDDDLLPYWVGPDALGSPVGNFPSFRGRNGELLPDRTTRGLSTLARGVFGYSVSFLLTGDERYLTWARAGLDWIDTHAKDPAYGGYFGQLDMNGNPVAPLAPKEVFDLASLGLAYGMYFNVTRDPDAEQELLAVRDLIFDKYYVPAENRIMDALSHDLTTEVDSDGAGGNITDLLVPGTAVLLPNQAILSDAARRAQFRTDLRNVTNRLIDAHKHNAANVASNRWMFWGRAGRVNAYAAPQTDFGHVIKSYEMIHNANMLFADRPWDWVIADRTRALNLAWDGPARRWNQRIRSFAAGDVVPDSPWWTHDEADQTLAALDLTNGFANSSRLALSAQSFLDVYVDRDPGYPARETFHRIERTGTDNDLRKSHFGKNMLHNVEHALILYLHGRAMAGLPATLHYAFPADRALGGVAKPYWFDAAAEHRTVGGPVDVLPGHVHVAVEFSGINGVPRPPHPAPADATAPVSTATVTPAANSAGWHRSEVGLTLDADDDLVGVKEIHVQVTHRDHAVPDQAWIGPGDSLTVPALATEGTYDVRWFAVDALGNEAESQHLVIRIDRTAPVIQGMPADNCELWPVDHRLVHVADVTARDALSGLAGLSVDVTANEATNDGEIVVDGDSVDLAAWRLGIGRSRVYTVESTAKDVADNVAVVTADCVVPHDQGLHLGTR